jgi:hypothetical protein
MTSHNVFTIYKKQLKEYLKDLEDNLW